MNAPLCEQIMKPLENMEGMSSWKWKRAEKGVLYLLYGHASSGKGEQVC